MPDQITHSSERQATSENDRNEIILALEEKFPHNQHKVTAQDILNLSILNATLAIITEFPEQHIEEKRAERAGLESERDKIVEKIARIVAYQTTKDALLYPKDDLIYSGLEHYADLLDKINYMDSSPDESEPGSYPLYADYEKILNVLLTKLGNGQTTKDETLVALRLAASISRFGTWVSVSKQCQDILVHGADTGKVEQLLQNIHQGGYEDSAKANNAQRPILDHIADRPWEVANTLTFIFAGYPWLSGYGLRASVSKWVKPNRDLPLVREYYNPTDIDPRRLEGATKGNTFLQASLNLASQLPYSAIEVSDFYMNQLTAACVVAGSDFLN
jgi:hypothetical protein